MGTVRLHRPGEPHRIEILNGYQIDDERFQGAIRVKQLRLEYSYGSTQIVDLYDSKEPQSITARSRPTEWLKLTVLSVYPDYIWEDAALSEVRLFESATQGEGRAAPRRTAS